MNVNMRERHLELASKAKTKTEEALHRSAASLHAMAHLSPVHRQNAVHATALAFDARCGGTAMDAGGEFDEGKHPRSDDGKFGSGGGGEGGGEGENKNWDMSSRKPKPLDDESHARATEHYEKLKKGEKPIGAAKSSGGPSEVHRSGKFSVRHDPTRKRKGMASYAVFEDDNPKAHSAHHDEGEAKREADHWHNHGTAMPDMIRKLHKKTSE